MAHFFPEQFPSFWIKFDAMVEAGDVFSVREVRKELELQSVHQHLLDWARGHASFFRIPGVDETEFVSQIFAVPKFLEMVRRKNILEGRPVADPFLVAAARAYEGCVVTEEKERRGSAQLPNVCAHYKVKCVNLEGFMSAEGMQY